MKGYLTHFGLTEAKTPFIDTAPSYTDEKFAEFAERIKVEGVQVPIDVDELGNILDGHTRQRAQPDCPFRIVEDLPSDDHKRAYAFRANHDRRHATPGQKKKALEYIKPTALRLIENNTQTVVAAMLGVSQTLVSSWASNAGMSSDKRKKLTKDQVEEIRSLVSSGVTQEDVARKFSINRSRVSQIVSIITHNNANASTKSDPICDRALAVRAAVVAGENASLAAKRLGFPTAQEYCRAAVVAESGKQQLIDAVNEGVLSTNTASRIRDKSKDDIASVISKAKTKQSLADQKKRGCMGKSAAENLISAIEQSQMLLRNYATHGIKKSDIPRSAKRRSEMGVLLDAFEKTATALLSDIRRELGCL